MTDVSLGTYRVTIAPDALERAGEIIRATAPAHRYAIVTDEHVGPIYASRIRDMLRAPSDAVFTIAGGEEHKTRESWSRLTDTLLAGGFGRDTTIIALGGGVVGDLAGFVAATFMRGVPFVQIPTTLLAMIDASIGGKTGVDTAAGKNLVGAFHQPAAVIVDPTVLASLPVQHLRAGLAEALKHGVIADEAYFDRVATFGSSLHSIDWRSPALHDLVARSVEIKADVVRRDEREGGARKTLNFGHTIGHAVELCSNYTILHGAAVAIGMVYESLIAERIGVALEGTAARILEAVHGVDLPSALPGTMSVDDLIAATRGDKKARQGNVEYALPARIGAMAGANRGWSMPVSEDLVRDVLA